METYALDFTTISVWLDKAQDDRKDSNIRNLH